MSPIRFLLFLGYLLSIPCLLAQGTPLRDSAKLAQAKDEAVVRVATAKVLLADYELLKKDFLELTTLSPSQIDEWILRHAGFVSLRQARQEIVNTRIQTGEESQALRPRDYGRALVFRAGETGLIDAKGVGSVRPVQGDHGNGLATLGEMIREYAYEKMVKNVFDHSGTGLKTIGTYAVLDLGFSVKHGDGSTSPAGSVLRQAHERSPGRVSLFPEAKSIEIEKVLRQYGLTSAGAYHHQLRERINIQGAKSGEVLDFGGFVAMEKFDKKATHFYGSRVLISPKDKEFVQPDPLKRVPLDLWGQTVSGTIDPKLDNPWIWSHQLAENLSKGEATRADAEQHVRNLVGPVEEVLSSYCYRRSLEALKK